MRDQEVIPNSAWLEWGGVFGAGGGALLLALLALAAAIFWWRRLRGLPARRRATLVTLRALGLSVLVFLLLRPALVRGAYEKSTDVVAVVYDDSGSMKVEDGRGMSRADRLRAALERHTEAFDLALNSRFHVLNYRAGAGAGPLADRAHLRFEAPETRLVDAAAHAARDLASLSAAAIVLISDGGQQPAAADEAWAELEAAGVPVYTVGVGEDGWRDLAIGEVGLSRAFFDEAPARITARFSAHGLSGRDVLVEVLRNGAVEASDTRRIERDFVEQQVQLEVAPRDRGWLDYAVRVRLKNPGRGGEFVAQNNQARVLLDHREKEYRILYFSGRPNWQNKFVRQALAGDPELRLSSLIRISGAEKSFVYQGERTSLGNPLFEGFEDESTLPRYDEAVFTRMGLAKDELADGYPVDGAALYPFHLIIWGDIEADFFAPAHFRVTRDAVSERGASFLMLGGPRSLADGGYAGSMIESMLPVMPGGVDPFDGVPGDVRSSPEGFLTGVWALNADAEANEIAWRELPPLPEVDHINATRIGASVLAEADRAGGASPFLVWRRFGEGRAALLATGETWPWHMQTEAGNDAHARIWRQLVRSLASTAPEPVFMEADPGVFVAGLAGNLTWTVRDALFAPVAGATLRARVIEPGGASVNTPLVERLDFPGKYEAPFTPAAPGRHLVILEGHDADGEPLDPVESAIAVEEDIRELADARFDDALLKALAARTGGQYFALEELDRVASAIRPVSRERARIERTPIWHHPGFYVALVLLFSAEWTLRRRWGLA